MNAVEKVCYNNDSFSDNKTQPSHLRYVDNGTLKTSKSFQVLDDPRTEEPSKTERKRKAADKNYNDEYSHRRQKLCIYTQPNPMCCPSPGDSTSQAKQPSRNKTTEHNQFHTFYPSPVRGFCYINSKHFSSQPLHNERNDSGAMLCQIVVQLRKE